MSDTKIHPTNAFGLDDEVTRDHKANAEKRGAEKQVRQSAQRARREGRAVTVPRETSPLRSSGQPGDDSEPDVAAPTPSDVDA